ncbi:TetR/AcrR family transcriptional regulator [Alicyclobacillus fastidiosus]|uniref:TetR/AcrR family transcriptional regulator n=1 Tax=Alicyclobacillus fastidiosus TaxID=392011 RepID=A0ABY6ZCR5_9BACL|nr:TetR/AcrR family transcriptional regulator [Alicyclobacillus fastidiosus]WAH40573.1 TetR/AcrR family transcriptional regulator [Alicyclobacillus fastidiosus]GMA62008.1 TetR family transcriptional regulator [Alicyclobacillus fastidiosus]
MGRPREFDVERALQQSMELFWTKGFKSTSFEDLTRTTRVKKQSLYCVFDDKRALFLKALALYREHSIAVLEEVVAQDMSPLKKLEYICELTLSHNDETLHKGCLMVNSALEFGSDDEEVIREVELMFLEVEQILEKVIRSGQEQQVITTRYTSKELAAHLNNAILGAKVLEKSGASRDRIEAVLRTSFGLIAT